MSPWLFAAAGLVLLFVGGELLVRGAVNLSLRLGISPLLVGLAVVGFGTSAPELLVSLQAATAGQPDIAVGNVVGSNIANVLLIIGTSALIRPLYCPPQMGRRDGTLGVVAAGLLILLAFAGTIHAWEGAVLLALLIGHLTWSYRIERRDYPPAAAVHVHETNEMAPDRMPAWVALAILLAGLAAVLLGARWLVDGAVVLARQAGVSEAVIGLTLVAVGTSLPELATSIVAALRGHNDVAIGNVLGSNLFNILAILGTTALVVPVPVSPELLHLDLWVMLAVMGGLLLLLSVGCRLGRAAGTAFLLLYGGYIAYLFR